MPNCPRHPSDVATDLCVECGEPVCGQCATVLADQRVFCPECREKVGVGPKPASRPVETREERPPPQAARPRFEAIPGGRARKPEALGRRSRRAFAAFWLSLVSCLCFPLAVIGLVLGLAELSAIKAGKAPAAGRTYAMAGAILCSLELIFWVLVFLAPKK